MQLLNEIEIAKWFLSRSDSLRESLTTRSTLVVASNAFLLTSIGIIVAQQPAVSSIITFKLIILVALACISVSVVLAVMAAIKIRPSHHEVSYTGPDRIFLNPRDTFKNLNSVEDFVACIKEDKPENLLNSICGELWVDLKLQHKRYRYQRASMRMLLPAFMITIFALILALWF
ncbi:MAG: hypothetical protein VST71_06615 [Nitrospirota bacterium]|nr:hypothetical protein [Nitrospirota bacterium]